jgi:23S rRNA (cytidine2498-2'-O)-methyltransferase
MPCSAGAAPASARTRRQLSERAALAGDPADARTERGSGYVEFMSENPAALSRALPFANLIFARQKLLRLADLPGLDPRDRITPMLAALDALAATGQTAAAFGELWVEYPDSDAGKTGRPRAQLRQCPAPALRRPTG